MSNNGKKEKNNEVSRDHCLHRQTSIKVGEELTKTG